MILRIFRKITRAIAGSINLVADMVSGFTPSWYDKFAKVLDIIKLAALDSAKKSPKYLLFANKLSNLLSVYNLKHLKLVGGNFILLIYTSFFYVNVVINFIQIFNAEVRYSNSEEK